MNKFKIHKQIHKHTLSWKIWGASQFLKVGNIGEVEENLAINNILSCLWKNIFIFGQAREEQNMKIIFDTNVLDIKFH